MRRIVPSAMLALLLTAPQQLAAQEAQNPGQVYVAYNKISFADMPEWTRMYFEHTVPVMQALQDEGLITGWNVWQHAHGGEYNWRFAIRTTEWAHFGRFWSAFFERLQQRSPDAVRRGNAMVQAHHDEIWDLNEVNVPDPAPQFQYFYDSQFQISFGDMAEWNRIWSEEVTPILNELREAGTLGGWVTEGHNTGGRFNWKVIYMFAEWDHIDDFFGTLLPRLMANAESWEKTGRMIAAHDDVIWTAVSAPGM